MHMRRGVAQSIADGVSAFVRCRKAVSAVKYGLAAAALVGGLATTAAMLASAYPAPLRAVDGKGGLVAIATPGRTP